MPRLLALTLLAAAPLFAPLATAGELEEAPAAPMPTSARWAWLAANGGTYWYVPSAYLPAYRWEISNPSTASQVEDQTVWHIDRYENGYFFGPAAAQLDDGRAMCQYMVGSITPAGRVYIAFTSQPAIGSPSVTTGIGDMTEAADGWAFAMQMATGSDRRQVAHWASMQQCREGDACWDSLPGTGSALTAMLAQCDDD